MYVISELHHQINYITKQSLPSRNPFMFILNPPPILFAIEFCGGFLVMNN